MRISIPLLLCSNCKCIKCMLFPNCIIFYRNANDTDKLFTFGGGSKCCIGEKLVRQLLRVTNHRLILVGATCKTASNTHGICNLGDCNHGNYNHGNYNHGNCNQEIVVMEILAMETVTLETVTMETITMETVTIETITMKTLTMEITITNNLFRHMVQ